MIVSVGKPLLGVAIVLTGLTSCVISEGVNALAHTGSGTFERINRQRNMERAVRDWCLTIRSVGIVPLYPLREDVEPGKMFVVTTPIEQLKRYWNGKGYLPIEREFDQLSDLPYDKWYGKAFGVSAKNTPNYWRDKTMAAGEAGAYTTNWTLAPGAALLEYSYKINRGEGITGALPIQGVPVMMSALGARSATVRVTLKGTVTYGIGEKALRQSLLRWEAKRENREWLAQYPPENGQPKWLRVVSRVYLIKKVSVSVTMDKASSAQVSAGQPKPVQNLFLAQGDAAGNFKAAAQGHPDHALSAAPTPTAPKPLSEAVPPSEAPVEPPVAGSQDERDALAAQRELALNTRETNLELKRAELEQQQALIRDLQRKVDVAEAASKFGGTYVPGVSARITSASSSAVSMEEEFPNPIVVGYEAIDFPINYPSDGESSLLPTAVSTFFRVQGNTLTKWNESSR